MRINIDKNKLQNNSTLIGRDYTVNNYYSYLKLDKEEYRKIIDRCYENCFELKIYSQKEELYKITLQGLNRYDWSIEEKQYLFVIIADTSKELKEKVEYYKGAADIAPDTVLGQTAYKFWKKCNILFSMEKIFTL